MWALHWLTSQEHTLCRRHAWKANNKCFDSEKCGHSVRLISQRRQFIAGLKVSEMDTIVAQWQQIMQNVPRRS